jgi:hypothetical protein
MRFKQVHLVTSELMCEVGGMEDSERDIILVCEVCGERTVLGGPLSVWRSESTTFGCGCGEQLTLADRLDPGGSNEASTTAAAEPPTSLLYP